jgi:hypothetical protein
MRTTILKPVAAALVAGAAALAANAANADVVVAIDSNPYVYVSPVQSTSFFDAFVFSVDPLTTLDVTVSVTSLENSLGDLSILSIADGTIQLWSTTGTPAPLSAAFAWGSSIVFQNVGPGAYGFAVTGTPTGVAGGLYAFSAQAVPVPEPGTWGMALTGGVLMAFALRRNSRAKS